VIGATDNAQTVNEIRTAKFRYEAQLRELERQFEAKAGELRQAYLDEVRGIYGAHSERSLQAIRRLQAPNHTEHRGCSTWLLQALP
jgi:hypothetical protein